MLPPWKLQKSEVEAKNSELIPNLILDSVFETIYIIIIN